MKVTYYGHSCFSVFIADKHILFDPYITPNTLASHISLDQVKADYIFLSHAHFDHVYDAVSIAEKTGAQVIGNFEIYQWLIKKGVKNAFPINPGGKFTFDFGTVKCVSAQHSSSFEDGTYGGIACGFVVQASEGTFYYSGDAALATDMELVLLFAKPDFAVFPIGDILTMGIEEAIAAAKMVQTGKVLGVHYNTFPWIPLDRATAEEQFGSYNLLLYLPEIGTTIDI